MTSIKKPSFRKQLIAIGAFSFAFASAATLNAQALLAPDFSGTVSSNSTVNAAIANYAANPTSANYDILVMAIYAANRTSLPLTTSTGHVEWHEHIEVTNNKTGAVDPAAGTTYTFSDASTGSSNSGGAFIFQPGSQGIFLAENGASYLFMGNEAGVYGGAIFAYGTSMVLKNGYFLGNISSGGGGGAIAAIGGSIVLTDASFISNVTDGIYGGGAIFASDSTVALSVTDGETTTFSGNYDNIGNSSMLLEESTVNILTQGGAAAGDSVGILDMRDPFRVWNGATINKNGEGQWKLGGTNSSDNLAPAILNVNEGTLYLYSEGEVGNPSEFNSGDRVHAGVIDFSAHSGSSFNLGTANGTGFGARLELGVGSSIIAGNVVLHDNATVLFKIDANGQTGKIIGNTVTVGGNLVLEIDGLSEILPSLQFDIFDGAISGTFSSITDSSGMYTWTFDTSTGIVSGTPIPEPSTYALFVAIGAVGLAVLRRRRKIRKN
ncbi:MAG: PEP-CTERM sorting domain-containing protein [Puniceicoccales bacterium]|jgi:hypothetical protein|nr:PEP-CTERM sorting domain-containing protein [Puniceicoccales bacterium]